MNYLVDMHDRKREFSMSTCYGSSTCLRCFDIGYWAEDVSNEDPNGDIPVWNGSPQGQTTMGEELNVTQCEQLRDLFKEFEDVLSSRPGRMEGVEHRIETRAANPVCLPTNAYHETVQRELKEMLAEGIIEPSTSEWAAPIILVPKKDRYLRLCVDYRQLNGVTQSDAYPMPWVDKLVDRLGGTKLITTLDLACGYWQVPVTEADRHKTAFTTQFGLHQFRVMPFGLQGAPATFQRMMDRPIDGCGAFTAAYLDDLVIHSNTWKEHLHHIKSIFMHLRAAGLTAKPSKCQFGMKKAPKQVLWNSECDRAFQQLKLLLCLSPVLRSPDFSKAFILQTNTSDHGIETVLSQRPGWRRPSSCLL